MQLKLTLSKLMMDNRIDQKVNSFGVSSLNKDYMIGLDPTNPNKINVNALMVFDVNGVSHEASRSKGITVIYDRETTKEKVKNAIEQLPFTLKFDANVLKKGIPGYMSHIDLNKLLRQGLKWSQEAILSDNQTTDNDLQNWTRKLMLGAEELVDIGVTYDDQKVAIKINTPEAKDGIIMHKVLGFDLAFKIITHGNQVKLEIPNEGKNGLEAFKEHVILAFTQLWDKINATDFGDEKQYPNLKKVPTKEGNLMGYKVSPRITTISLYPVVAFNINFGSTEQPFNVICVMEQRDGQSLELKFIDEFGRTRESNTIQKDAKSSLSMGTADGGFKIGEFRGTDQPYTGINYEGPKAGLLSKALKTYNPSTRELVHRDPKTLKTLARMKTEVSDQGTSKAKEVGYRYDSKNKTVQVTSDHFSHVLHFAQGHNEPSVLEKGVALGISETQISAKFKELFDKTFEGKNQLPGIIVDGRYATVDTKNDDKTTIVKEHLPDEVLAIITALHNYLDGVAKLHTMKVEVSVDGRGKSGKENRNVFASIAGEQGVGKTPVKGIDTFDHSQKLNPAIYTLITGKGNKAEIDFNIRNNSDVLLISDKVDMDGTEYTLKYDSRNNTLYLIPPKK
ncbi:MAG: hypothetical protein Q4B28_02220 [bacterium]|nr:hypothetical protein [bacterium]